MNFHKFMRKLMVTVLSLAIFVSSVPALSLSAENSDGVIRVMPLGDSITDGYWLTGGYRNTLCQLLQENGYSDNVDLVGPLWGGDGYDTNHAGYSGYSIDNIAQEDSISGARTGISSFIDWLMQDYPADVVMLQIGTNDILSYYDLDNISVRLSNLVNTILSYMDSDGMLYIATIPCMDANNTLYISEYYFTPELMDQIVDKYNTEIKELVSSLQQQGKNVELADINSVVSKDDLYDGVHPNAEGYEKMGEYWYSKLSEYLTGFSAETSQTSSETQPDAGVVIGDIDDDGIASSSDIILLKNHLIREAELTEVQAEKADINQDGIINVFDLIEIKNSILYGNK